MGLREAFKFMGRAVEVHYDSKNDVWSAKVGQFERSGLRNIDEARTAGRKLAKRDSEYRIVKVPGGTMRVER